MDLLFSFSHPAVINTVVAVVVEGLSTLFGNSSMNNLIFQDCHQLVFIVI